MYDEFDYYLLICTLNFNFKLQTPDWAGKLPRKFQWAA